MQDGTLALCRKQYFAGEGRRQYWCVVGGYFVDEPQG